MLRRSWLKRKPTQFKKFDPNAPKSATQRAFDKIKTPAGQESPTQKAWAKTQASNRKAILKAQSSQTSAVLKTEIQALLREIAILRDGGCVLRDVPKTWITKCRGTVDIPHCNGYNKNGEYVLQFDHLNSRRFNVSFANPDLGVCVCRGHHGWKKWNEEIYNEIIRTIIGPERCASWDRAAADRATYHMDSGDWAKVKAGLEQALDNMRQNQDDE